MNSLSGESHQLNVPRPPRLSRPKPYEKPHHIKEEPGNSPCSSNQDTSYGSNLVIDHPDDDEQHSDRDSVKVCMSYKASSFPKLNTPFSMMKKNHGADPTTHRIRVHQALHL